MVVNDHFDLMLVPPHFGHLIGTWISGMIIGLTSILLSVFCLGWRSWFRPVWLKADGQLDCSCIHIFMEKASSLWRKRVRSGDVAEEISN